MDEIRKLQQQLYDAQIQDSVHRLSDFNIVELVTKLTKLGMLDILYTLNGKEYLTYKELESEIQDEIMMHGGRINVTELSPILNVDLTYIEDKVEEIVKKDSQLMKVGGEIIASYYLDTICEEINERLQESGVLSLGELSKQFNFSLDFMREVIEPRMASIIQGKLSQGTLFTMAYVQRQTAQMRGVFSAITSPVAISQIQSDHSFNEGLFQSVFNDLLKNKLIAGTCQGRRVFTPALFLETQRTAIQTFFAQNGYIAYDTLKKLQISNPQQFLSKQFPKGMALDSCFLSENLVMQVDAAVEDAMKRGSWIDTREVTPTFLGEEDAATLVSRCPYVKAHQREIVTVADAALFSTKQLEEVARGFEPMLRERAAANANKPAPAEEKVVEKPAAVGKGKGKKGGGKKGGKGGSVTPVKETKKASGLWLTDVELINSLRDKLPDCEEDVLEGLGDHIASNLLKLQEELRKNVVAANAVEQRKERESFEETLQTLYHSLQLFQNGAAAFDDEEDVSTLSKHLLKTVGLEALVLFLKQHTSEPLDPNKLQQHAQRVKVIKTLATGKKEMESLTALSEAQNGKSVDDFIEAVDNTCDVLQLRLKPLDKKSLRTMTFNRRQQLLEQLHEETEPPIILHLSCVVVASDVLNVIVHMPGKFVKTLMKKLEGKISDEASGKLEEYHSLVLYWIQKEKGGEEDPRFPPTTIESLTTALREMVSNKKYK